ETRFYRRSWMFSSDDEGKSKIEERVKETQKVFGYVFDKFTILNIYKLFTSGTIGRFEFPISSGKESLVFAASKKDEFYAVKIYRTVASTFKNIERYAGQRWGVENTGNKRKFISQWSHREFRNLSLAFESGVKVPRPIKVVGNILVMQYIGTKRVPAPLMKDCEITKEIVDQALDSIRTLYIKAKLVHGDLSEYNFLVYRKRPYMIDIAQAIQTDDAMASVLLHRDIEIMTRFFNKFGYKLDEDSILKYTVGDSSVFR
ncbi:MAG: RIO1 family regulatory kinase/ATPase, partial [Thermoplasmatales archaeon]